MKVLFQAADEKLLIELLVISWGWICCWGRRRLLAKNTWWPIQELESSSHRCWRPVWFSYVSDGLQTLSTVHCVNWAPHLPSAWPPLFSFFMWVPSSSPYESPSYPVFIYYCLKLLWFLYTGLHSELFSLDIHQSRVQLLHRNLFHSYLNIVVVVACVHLDTTLSACFDFFFF